MEEVCERCGWLKNPASLATLEYYALTIRVCFPCMVKVAGILGRTPLARRIAELQKRKEDWRKGREAREERAS